MPLYDWICEDGHFFTRKAGYDAPSLPCACGKPASRQSVYRLNFGGFAPTTVGQQDFSEDYRRFREASETIDDKVSRRERDTGTQIDVPFYKQATKRAKRLASLGVTADSIKT